MAEASFKNVQHTYYMYHTVHMCMSVCVHTPLVQWARPLRTEAEPGWQRCCGTPPQASPARPCTAPGTPGLHGNSKFENHNLKLQTYMDMRACVCVTVVCVGKPLHRLLLHGCEQFQATPGPHEHSNFKIEVQSSTIVLATSGFTRVNCICVCMRSCICMRGCASPPT